MCVLLRVRALTIIIIIIIIATKANRKPVISQDPNTELSKAREVVKNVRSSQKDTDRAKKPPSIKDARQASTSSTSAHSSSAGGSNGQTARGPLMQGWHENVTAQPLCTETHRNCLDVCLCSLARHDVERQYTPRLRVYNVSVADLFQQ